MPARPAAALLDQHAATLLDRQLAELPEILTHARMALQPGAGARGSRVSGATRTPPLPCNLHALDQLAPGRDDTPSTDVLARWARIVLDDRAAANDWTAWLGQWRVPVLRGEIEASVAIKVLHWHQPWLITRYYARDIATEVAELHSHLNKLARWPLRSARPVRTPCPDCRCLGLCERTDGVRECLVCRTEFTPAEYDQRVQEVAAALAA